MGFYSMTEYRRMKGEEKMYMQSIGRKEGLEAERSNTKRCDVCGGGSGSGIAKILN